MEYRQLGQSDLSVSALCLGTMTFGQQNTQNDAFEQLNYAVDNGINFIDTAELYPVPPRAETYTKTETIVGNWLATQQRDKVILATKVAGPNRHMPWIRGGPKSVDAINVQQAIDGSLKRLQTDYIDLYQIHWPARNVPMFGQFRFDPRNEIASVAIQTQLEALAAQVKAGKVRYIGLSNETPWGIMSFLQIAKDFNLPRIVSVQNAYNLINRTFETGLTEIAYREQIGLLAYSPLAFGHLTAKYQQSPHAAGRITAFPSFGQRYEKPNVPPSVQAYAELAKRYGLSPAEMALSFVYRQWFTTSTIIGATNMTQLNENIGAWSKPLSADLLADIDALQLLYMNPAP